MWLWGAAQGGREASKATLGAQHVLAQPPRACMPLGVSPAAPPMRKPHLVHVIALNPPLQSACIASTKQLQ